VQLEEGQGACGEVIAEGIVQTTRQCIGFSSLFAWTKDDDKIVVGEFFGPSGLSMVVHLGLGKLQKVLVI
jgi:hypothetical protein